MMLFQAGRGIDPGELHVRLNPGDRGEFAVIELTGDGAALFIFAPAEADRLIAAAVEAKRLLDPPAPATDLCDSTMPLLHGGELKCTAELDENGYHHGSHTALGGRYRWLGTGLDARTEDGDLIVAAPQAVTS